ncbi:hypothetical protein [Paraburkholderia oxyphila]|nr:hypothetical protein [Paraburkholderia oxyphila]
MRPWLVAIMVIVAIATTIGHSTAGYAHDKGDGYAGPPIGFKK